MKDFKITELFNFFNNCKKEQDIVFIGKFEVTERDIEIAKMSAELLKEINVDRKIGKIDKYDRGAKNDQINFMCALSQNHFAKILHGKFDASNKRIKIKSPAIASYFVQKKEQDFQMKYKDDEINFDLKSQYFHSSTSSVNINKDSHHRFLDNNIDFYIVAIFRNNNKNYKDFDDVNSIYYFVIPKNYVHEQSKLIITKAPFYSMHIKKFIEKIA